MKELAVEPSGLTSSVVVREYLAPSRRTPWAEARQECLWRGVSREVLVGRKVAVEESLRQEEVVEEE